MSYSLFYLSYNYLYTLCHHKKSIHADIFIKKTLRRHSVKVRIFSYLSQRNIVSCLHIIISFFQCLEKVPNWWTLLDVWIANGTFAHFVHMIRPDIIITWLDITDVKELIPSYVNFVQGDASQFSLPWKFDMIMCNHLLEHMPVEKVPDVLSSINKHLTSTGVFWFTVPSLFHWFYNDPTHIRPYTKEAIKRLLPIADFSYTKKVIKEWYYFRYPIRFLKFPHFRITYWYIQKWV